MKKLLIALSIFASISVPAFAAVPDDCWKESGKDVIDGQFLLFVNAKDMTAKDVLDILQKSKYSAGLLPTDFPTTIDDQNVLISLKYGTNQVSPVVSRDTLKVEANRSIQEIMQIPGVSVSCNNVFHNTIHPILSPRSR